MPRASSQKPKSVEKPTPSNDGRLRSLKRAEYFNLGQLIQRHSKLSHGIVHYNEGWSDETVTKEAQLSISEDISIKHVAKTRQTLLGRLADENSSAKQMIATIYREMRSLHANLERLSDRVTKIEDWLTADESNQEPYHNKIVNGRA